MMWKSWAVTYVQRESWMRKLMGKSEHDARKASTLHPDAFGLWVSHLLCSSIAMNAYLN